jgi:hypothetical protein
VGLGLAVLGRELGHELGHAREAMLGWFEDKSWFRPMAGFGYGKIISIIQTLLNRKQF